MPRPPRPPSRPRLAFKPIATRAHILRWWLVAGIVVDAGVTILYVLHLRLLDADRITGNGALLASDERLVAAGAAQLAVLAVSIVLWLVWFHRAYRNLESLRSISLRFGTGWAIGAWFVPILNWFRPKQIANDIWRGTDPDPSQGGTWTDAPVSPLVHWWWASWLVSSFLGNLSARLFSDAQTLSEQRTVALVDIAAGITFVVCGVLAVLFVRAVTERQVALAAQVHGAEADASRMRADRHERSRRRPAVIALTLAGAAALVFAVGVAANSASTDERDAAGQAPERQTASVFELRPGDCVNGLTDTRGELRVVETLPCSQPHEAEVLPGFELPGRSFPGNKAIAAKAERRCNAALLAAVRPQRDGPGSFFLSPTRQSWALGDRAVTCIALFDAPRRGALQSL